MSNSNLSSGTIKGFDATTGNLKLMVLHYFPRRAPWEIIFNTSEAAVPISRSLLHRSIIEKSYAGYGDIRLRLNSNSYLELYYQNNQNQHLNIPAHPVRRFLMSTYVAFREEDECLPGYMDLTIKRLLHLDFRPTKIEPALNRIE